MKKKSWIVLTSINSPTTAVREFATLALERGWGMVVVGDTKTPPDWQLNGVDFLSIERQHQLFPAYSRKAPTYHYARKNFGYLYALGQGAEVIVESDDDNHPYPSFALRQERRVMGRRVSGADWVNAYRYFTDALIWPRGLPLDRIHQLGLAEDSAVATCPIQQFLADADPDVDAIYRLLYKEPCNFDNLAPDLIVSKNTFCPFNSQNTIFFPEAFDLLYLPSYVSFRMTDIWRAFVAQRIMWERGHELSFHAPTVFQKRNEHDLMCDFSDEVVGYLRNAEIASCLSALQLEGQLTIDMLRSCYLALQKIGIVPAEELVLVNMWLQALNQVRH